MKHRGMQIVYLSFLVKESMYIVNLTDFSSTKCFVQGLYIIDLDLIWIQDNIILISNLYWPSITPDTPQGQRDIGQDC